MDINKATVLIIICESEMPRMLFSELYDNDIKSIGTGFFIDGNGTISTAGHVLNIQKNERPYVVINDRLIQLDIKKQYDLVGDGDYNDYALCTADVKSPHHFDIKKFTEPRDNEPLFLTGYTRKVRSSNHTELKYSDGTVYHNQMTGRFLIRGIRPLANMGIFPNGFTMLFDETLSDHPNGMSGGPITNANSELVGHLISGYLLTGGHGLFSHKLSEPSNL
jgi:hypothetical protein